MCANCGNNGHIIRSCNEPVTSYGIICYRIRENPNTAAPELEYLMVQRKDSMSYVEFLRAKYHLYNRKYIMKMFAGMTQEERQRLLDWSFDDIWRHFWQNEQQRAYTKDYNHSRNRFMKLRDGVKIKYRNGNEEFFSIKIGIEGTVAQYRDTEFGFPKGRRNMNESDIKCSLREFSEETGVNARSIELMPGMMPLEEQFVGSNNVSYKHCYYIAHVKPDAHTLNDMPSNVTVAANANNPVQMREIKSIGWFDAAQVLEHIREQYHERRMMFSNLDIALRMALTSSLHASRLLHSHSYFVQLLQQSIAHMQYPPMIVSNDVGLPPSPPIERSDFLHNINIPPGFEQVLGGRQHNNVFV